MLNKLNILKLGKYLFLAGTFTLSSAPFISSIFFIFSFIVSFYCQSIDIFRDKWNILLFCTTITMVIIALIHNIYYEDIEALIEDKILYWTPRDSWLGLANWIPLFLFFICSKPFLSSKEDRKNCAKSLLAGSVPVIITGFGQYFFEWYGPMHTLNRLIIWFQRPPSSSQGLTGLFNNQNYAGCWLNIIWPFSIAFFVEKSLNFYKKSILFAFIISISTAIFLTTSRSAWGGLLVTLPLLAGGSTLFIFLLFVIIIPTLVITNNQIFELSDYLKEFIPDKFNILHSFDPSNYSTQELKRSFIFMFASKMISNKLLLGWGASSFPIYYILKNQIYIGHTHNLFLEIAFSYGMIPSIFIYITIISLFLISLKIIFFKKKDISFSDHFFEKAWWTSFFVLAISQMVDLQYLDIRISTTFWILLAGLREIIKENQSYALEQKKL